MFNIWQLFLVFVVIVITILGLNVSNQAINSLVLENRGPIISVALENHDLNVAFLGEIYTLEKETSQKFITIVKEYTLSGYEAVKNHMLKIWNIFYAVFLY
ncbi:hypothetical protein SYNTR_1409 [Candidatus Syntrophocurvum alkaliphilum]|uniref:Uncharacterized protein n=1 Tax=Candidatus Syntrophocurvum alkaliphilum TaxID=2293317 RepID=A0A6I6DGK1_9FIRM|nr:hypothetical protein [Candidatus Syntrophocurvum alkaliphilum]QGU00003.1 hypothetical protein SYNTR_1409 [Candidatus Syntrophocurvum alkaliphilum]